MKIPSLKTWLCVAGSIFLFLVAVIPARAQDAASPMFTVFAGAGSTVAGPARGEVQAGASFDEAPPNAGVGFSFEGGYLGAWSRPGAGSAIFSADYMASWAFGEKGRGTTPNGKRSWSDRGWKVLPFASAGYTQLFGTGNAVNFGGGVDYRLNDLHAIRVEVRDYYSPGSRVEHNVALRIGWVAYVSD
ncbi:MAG TPA: hypothetical protein VMB02_01655 [Candidatus Aquilonibacter sp.]|nr:hypothetical protein [Candidatus Aquilonibacter sp.]